VLQEHRVQARAQHAVRRRQHPAVAHQIGVAQLGARRQLMPRTRHRRMRLVGQRFELQLLAAMRAEDAADHDVDSLATSGLL